MKILSVSFLLLLISSSCATHTSVRSPDIEKKSESAFLKLQTLEGAWKRTGTDGSKFQIVFSSTARKSLLIEDWQRKGKSHSLTVYHRDNQGLVATHYCPQGNQPRLRMLSNKERISFVFQDGTNLTDKSSYQSELSFEFAGDKLIRREKYSGDPKESVLELERIR